MVKFNERDGESVEAWRIFGDTVLTLFFFEIELCQNLETVQHSLWNTMNMKNQSLGPSFKLLMDACIYCIYNDDSLFFLKKKNYANFFLIFTLNISFSM